MKKILSICFLLGFMALFMPVKAQDDLAQMVTEEMTSYYKDLVKLDQQIVTAEDAERLENRYKNQLKLVESCYNDYTEIFRYDKKLYAVYENYTDLYQQLGKRIEELKAEQARLERFEKLNTKFNRYLETLTELEEAGSRCVENKTKKSLDSLNLIKKQAQECYVDEATVDYGANRDFIDDDEELAKIWKQIKDTYTRIEAMEILQNPIDLTMILEIVGIVAAVVLIVTMISTKIKAAKLTRPPKEPKKPKKKEEDLPSI